MAGSVLVAYATRSGSTREVAEAVAATLREHHLEVDIQPMKAVSSLAGYRAVVLGAPLFMFRWHKDARRLLSRHRQALQERPVAVFALGPFHDVEEEWERVRGQLEKTLAKFPWFKPVDIEIFGGKFDPALLRFPWNLLPALRMMPRLVPGQATWPTSFNMAHQSGGITKRLPYPKPLDMKGKAPYVTNSRCLYAARNRPPR